MGQRSPCNVLRDLRRMSKYNEKKREQNFPALSKHNLVKIDIPPIVKPPSFSSLVTPPEVLIQAFIPKLRNMKIEIEFTLTEVCDYRDIVDLNHEHIRVLSYVISQIERLRPR